jgi:hypothetical protein
MVKPGKLPPKPVDTVAEEEEPVNTESLAFLTQVQEDCKSKE